MLLSIPTNVRITYTPGNDYALLEWDAPTSRGSSAITGYVLARDDGGGAACVSPGLDDQLHGLDQFLPILVDHGLPSIPVACPCPKKQETPEVQK